MKVKLTTELERSRDSWGGTPYDASWLYPILSSPLCGEEEG